MDLVAAMVFDRLRSQHASALDIERICPALHPRFAKFPIVGAASALHNADRLWNRFFDYPRSLKPQLDRFDLFHLVDHSYSQLVHDLPAGKAVVTCHDLDTFRCVLEPDRQRRPLWFRAMTGRILSGFRKAAHVIAVSAATRDEILRFQLHPPERVTVVANGVHPSCSPLPDADSDAAVRRLLSQAGSAEHESFWLLNVGSSMPRKRLDVLLRVLAEVRKSAPQARLLRVGERFTPEQRALATQLAVNSSVLELGSVNREVLAAVYRRADLLVHTADAEGFGLPLVEAMACGCPVIASDLPVLREVGGSAAAYCAVGDVEGWAKAVLASMKSTPQQRQNIREIGFANASRFTWSENAASTVKVYEETLRLSNSAESRPYALRGPSERKRL
jgi:glycosyltransferase involved in cell wall biosynthesis